MSNLTTENTTEIGTTENTTEMGTTAFLIPSTPTIPPSPSSSVHHNFNESSSSGSWLSPKFLWTLSGFELAIHPAAAALSLFSFALVLRTAVLHRNLRFILLSQNMSIVDRALTRFAFVVIKFTGSLVPPLFVTYKYIIPIYSSIYNKLISIF